jgi:hypothetical protein
MRVDLAHAVVGVGDERSTAVRDVYAPPTGVRAEERHVSAGLDERLHIHAHLGGPVLVVADAEQQSIEREQLRIGVQVEVGAELHLIARAFEPSDERSVPVGQVVDAPGAVHADLVPTRFNAVARHVDGIVIEAARSLDSRPVGTVVGMPSEAGLLVENLGASRDAGPKDEELPSVAFEVVDVVGHIPRRTTRLGSDQGGVAAGFNEEGYVDTGVPVRRRGELVGRPVPVHGG